jgi:peptide/nickel transport system substrate-binding protein
MEFERFNDFYYQPEYGLPEDRRVKFTLFDLRMVPEEATRASAIRSGQADIAIVSLGVKGQVEAGGGRLAFGQEGSYINAKLEGCWHSLVPCRDKRVRQALDYAIDKQTMMEALYGGPTVAQAKGWAVVTPGSMGYGPDLDPWPFDPDKARQLLADAGYPGGEGFGKLILNTHVSALTPLLPESAQLAAENWRRELGLDVEVKVGDRSALNAAERAQELDGQVYWRDNEARLDGSGALVQSYADPNQQSRLHDDPELFELAQESFSINDPTERAQAYISLYRRLREETYELGIGYVNIPWAVGPRIMTWQPLPFSSYPTGLHTITLK